MSVMDKLINAMKINDDPYDDEPDDDYYEDEEEDIEEEDSREEEEEEVPAPRQVRRRASAIEKEPAPERYYRYTADGQYGRVEPGRPGRGDRPEDH